MEHIGVTVLLAIAILLNGCVIGMKIEAGEPKRQIARPIIMAVVAMVFLVLTICNLEKSSQDTYRADFQDGQVAAKIINDPEP